MNFHILGQWSCPMGARLHAEVDRRIGNASKAFGALRKAVFDDENPSLSMKRKVYNASVLSVLLYGSEIWTLLRKHLKRLDGFHHKCTMLRITNQQQWEQHITSESVREKWGDPETISSKVIKSRLEWLGHVARMPDYRIPKKILFGWLLKSRPAGGPRKQWHDHIRKDLKLVGVSESDCYYEATHSRNAWRAVYWIGLDDALEQEQQDVGMQSDPNK